jgi:tetratricopeptide (TPR) repeat protein
MKDLRCLIAELKPHEIRFIQSYYNPNSKRLKLLDLLLTDKVGSNKQTAMLIYGQENNSAFCHLKKRLKEDILNFMLLLPADKEKTQIAVEELACLKLLLQGKILLSRGIHKIGTELLEKTSRMAEMYEFPDIKLSSDDTLRSYQSSVGGQKRMGHYDKLITNSFDSLKQIMNAKRLNQNVSVAPCPPLQSINQWEKRAEASLKKLNDEEGKYTSRKAFFLHKMTLLESSLQKSEFTKAKTIAQELFRYLDEEPLLQSTPRVAEVNLKLAEINLQLRDYQNAIAPAYHTLSVSLSQDRLYPLQVLFFAYLRNRNFTEAENLCQEALNFPDTNQCLLGKWKLFKAALHFSQQDYQQTIKQLSTAKLNSKLSFWSLGQKLLEVLATLEMQDYDWFEYKFDAFRRKASRFDIDRLTAICELFRILIRVDFDYDKVAHQKDGPCHRLKGSSSFLGWNPMGWELVNVYDWIMSKAQLSQ